MLGIFKPFIELIKERRNYRDGKRNIDYLPRTYPLNLLTKVINNI